MNGKALTGQLEIAVPENWAKWWQVSGRPRLLKAGTAGRNRNRDEGFDTRWKFLVLICVFMMPCTVFAQNDHASWENLSAISAGSKIQVVDLHNKKISGALVSFSSTNISLEAPSGAQTFLRPDVRRVTLMESRHRIRNTLIGAAVGAGAGAGVSAATWENHGFAGGKGTGAAVGAGIGAICGAIVGALWPSHQTIYRSAGQ